MRTHRSATEMEIRAAEALGALLHQVSSIKTRDIKFQSAGSHRPNKILADVEVLGHSHKLVCNVADEAPGRVRKALHTLRTDVEKKAPGATPVLIAAHLSAQMRAMCEEHRVGFLDLEGNAHLVLDEVFICKRSVRRASPNPIGERISA